MCRNRGEWGVGRGLGYTMMNECAMIGGLGSRCCAMRNERAVVVRSGFLEGFDASHVTEATFGTMSQLVGTVTGAGVRAERVGAPGAVGRLVTLVELQAVDSSCTSLKRLCACTGLWGVGGQLLESPAVVCELQRLESRRVCTGVVPHVPLGGIAGAISSVV